MKVQVSLFAGVCILMSYFLCTDAITCLKCSNARNHHECRLIGKYEECNFGEVCSTTVRRNGLQQSFISKSCKQREACLNEQNQNWHSVGQDSQVCNRNRRESTCRCCCFSDFCNNRETCSATAARDLQSCPQLVESFTNGRRRCPNSNRVGSVCNFRCSSNYQVNPIYSEQITCLPNGKWNKPEPCCSRPCPPHLYIDLVILRHFFDHRLLLSTVEKQLKNLLQKVSAGPNSLRIALPHYDSDVHTPFLGFRDTANLTSKEILSLSIEENSNSIINSSVTNTGAALWFVHRNLFNTEFDRPNARNVLVLITDSASDDNVSAPARALRQSGVTIYSYFFKSEEADQVPNISELDEISGFSDKRRIFPAERTAADELFFENLCPGTCNV